MKTFTYKKQQALFKKATGVIPCGIYGHFSPAPLIPATDYPFFTAKAKGAHVWDPDGNQFIDYMCAYGPMVHGYANTKIDAAAAREVKLGNCTTGAPPVMVELAEYLVDMTLGMQWAFFAKNGADAVNYAAMIARDATGRKKFITFEGGYHGTSPWMQGEGHHGVIEDDTRHVLQAKWNDFDSVENIVNENKGQIAALIASPYLVPTFRDNELPAEGFWERVDALCKKDGIILISDDIRHGFRIDIRGSHAKYGYTPDMVCYCKAIGNGYPISACLGTDAMKPFAARVFHTGSYWFQSQPMAAALATLKEHRRINTPKVCTAKGGKLLKGLVDTAARYGYDLRTSGDPSMPFLRITNDPSLMLHQDWCAEATKRGAFFTSHHNWFISTAHTDADIAKTIRIADEAFNVIKKKYGDEY